MVRIFEAGERDFNNNGLVVVNPIKCKVTHELEGDFYLDLTCGKEYLDYIKPSYLVVAPTPQGDQAFRIKSVTKTGAKIEAKAWHVMYDLQNYLILAAYSTDSTCENALLWSASKADRTCPFRFSSDIETINTYTALMVDMLTAVQEIAKLYKGHIIPDNWNISVNSTVGTDNQITISYGKNLEELTAEYDFSDVCTKVLPVGKDETIITELYLEGPTQYDVPYSRVVTFEQDIEPESYEVSGVVNWSAYESALESNLIDLAYEYLQEHQYPVVNYTLKGKPEMVSDVGDIIEVKDKRIGVDLLTQVISYEYDSVSGAYVSLEFGNFTNSLRNLLDNLKTDVINQTNYTVQNSVSKVNNSLITVKEDLTYHIEGGFAAIIGGMLYIGDASPVRDSTVVYKWNSGGLSRSETGMRGPFRPVINSAGSFSVYDGSTVRGELSADNGLYVYDADGNTSATLNSTDGLQIYNTDGDVATIATDQLLHVKGINLGPYINGEQIKCGANQWLMGYIITASTPKTLRFTVNTPRAVPYNKRLTVTSLKLQITQDGDLIYNLDDVATNSNYTVTVDSRTADWQNSLTITVEARSSAYYYSVHGVVAVTLKSLEISVAD